jgi:phage shock protein PspC (stress-responsive transcriptional regulator)
VPSRPYNSDKTLVELFVVVAALVVILEVVVEPVDVVDY